MIVRSDALALPLRNGCVDLVVTSPPYFALRSYRDGDEHYAGQLGSEETPAAFVEALLAATAEMVRVLKPTGSIFVNLGDKYAGSGGGNQSGLLAHRNPALDAVHDAKVNQFDGPRRYNQNSDDIRAKSLMGLPWRYANAVVDQLGLILRAEIIWNKPNGLPESVTDRVRRSHEQWFHFVKSPRYYAAVDEIREAHADTFHATRRGAGQPAWEHGPKGEEYAQDRFDSWGERTYNPLGKLPGSVWTIPSEPLIVPDALGLPDHFAAFPQEWPRRLILGWSPPGVCVKCGEGRRPVVDKQLTNVWHDKAPENSRYDGTAEAHRNGRKRPDDPMMNTFGSTEATITGYACACDVPLAKTRPAVVLDPFGGTGTVAMVARALGRIGINGDMSPRLPASREMAHLPVWSRREERGSDVGRTARSDALMLSGYELRKHLLAGHGISVRGVDYAELADIHAGEHFQNRSRPEPDHDHEDGAGGSSMARPSSHPQVPVRHESGRYPR
jgi:DNA modification methylase